MPFGNLERGGSGGDHRGPNLLSRCPQHEVSHATAMFDG
jgi:hypothetical protein